MIDSLTQLDERIRSAVSESEQRLAELVGSMIEQRKSFPGFDMNLYISLQEASKMFNCKPETIAKKKEAIGYCKPFGQILFLKTDLYAFIEGTRPEPKPKKGIMFTRRQRAA